MKKILSVILAVVVLMLYPAVLPAFAYAGDGDTAAVTETAGDETPSAQDCVKILLIGNSFTYHNGLEQMLCRFGVAAGRDLLVVSATKGGCDANKLLVSKLSYQAWRQGERIAEGSGKLDAVAQTDFGDLGRAGQWDYVVLQNNAQAELTGMGDVYMLGFFTDMIPSNKHFILHSNYRSNSLETARHEAHLAVAKAAGCSLIDTRGYFAQYHTVFNHCVWFKDLTVRDSVNHPSVRGTYVFALSIYAKIFGTKDFPDHEEDARFVPFFNTEDGDITEILDPSLFFSNYQRTESITESDTVKYQYLIKKYADEYLGAPISESEKASLPRGGLREDIRYFDENGEACFGRTELSGTLYYLDDGYIVTDTFTDIDGKPYYFDSYGETKNGWFKLEDSTYFAFEDGSIAKGWQENTIADKQGVLQTFYFDEDGVLAVGTTVIDNKTYYFSLGRNGKTKGTMFRSEWRESTSSGGTVSRRYYNKNGVMLTGIKTVNGKKHCFSDNGILQKKRLVTVKGKTYYAGKDGVLYTDRFATVGGKRYYFNAGGAMVKNKLFAYGKNKYYADKNGYIRKGWVRMKGNYYYFATSETAKRPKYAMVTGKYRINGKVYKFTKTGICKNI